MTADFPSQAEPESRRQGSVQLRHALLSLHKALIASERVTFEKTLGKIPSPTQFLQLLAGDPWFT